MKLTKYEQEMLDGKHGEAKRYCMEKLVDFGIAVGAEKMVPVTLVLNGCPLWPEGKSRQDPSIVDKLNAYDLGHSPLYDPIFEMEGAHVADESGCACGNDPTGWQIDAYDKKGYPWNFEVPGKGSFKVDEDIRVMYEAGYKKLDEHGWLNWLSCNPYFNTRVPKMGEYCASSESSAAAYINSILGGRGNRESAVNTVYIAYTGCVPLYGTMLDENRAAKVIIEIDEELKQHMTETADWAALGAAIAEKADNRIPAIVNLPDVLSPTATKQLIATCSPGMNDPMLHLIGITPESPTLEAAFKGKMPKDVERYTVTRKDVANMYAYLNQLKPVAEGSDVHIVIFGCPHCTFEEIREVARLVKGKKIKEGVHLWVQTDTPSYWMAHQYGDTKTIEEAGGKVFHQTCMVMLPMRHMPQDINIGTTSFKYMKLGSGFGQNWFFANPKELIESAITGKAAFSNRWKS